MYKKRFDDGVNYEYCGDKCIYNSAEARQVLDLEAYDVITKLGMIYTPLIKYFNLLFFNGREKLFAANRRDLQTTINQT